ncbi:MAG TPA: globin domain-containing protein [Sphingomicrobium sp.]|jgi:nitric oxide dioxygenase
MTPLQVRLVQDSFSAVMAQRAEASVVFYRRLFAVAPDMRRLFSGDQSRKALQVLTTIVDNLDQLGLLLDSVEYLAQRHASLGVREHHYALVGQALIETLRECLGERFTRETERAWGYAYTILSGRMVRAELDGRRLAA